MIDSRFGNPGHRIVVHNKASWIMLLQMQEHKTSVCNVANSVVRKPNDPLRGSSPRSHRKRLPAKLVPASGPNPRRAERYPPTPHHQSGQRVTRPHRNRAETYPHHSPGTIHIPMVPACRRPAVATTGKAPTKPTLSQTVPRIHSPALRSRAATAPHTPMKDCHAFAISAGSCLFSKASAGRYRPYDTADHLGSGRSLWWQHHRACGRREPGPPPIGYGTGRKG